MEAPLRWIYLQGSSVDSSGSPAASASQSCSQPEERVEHLKEKIATVRKQMKKLKGIGQELAAAPDQQVSLTDPDARSMATSGRGTGIVGYNVQTAVDSENHLIVSHEAVNQGHDCEQLASMAERAKEATGNEKLQVLADRGYFDGEEILKCEQADIAPLVPRPLTSNARAEGRFDKRDFAYNKRRDEYRCPAGQRAVWRFTTVEKGLTLHKYWSSACPQMPDQKRMYSRRLSPNHTLGARGGARPHAGAT